LFTRFEQWKDFASSANAESWGKLYKWNKKGNSRNSVQTSLKTPDGDFTRSPMETASLILKTLIPHDGSECTLTDPHAASSVSYYLQTDEVKAAIWRIGPKKAPGKDGIIPVIVRKSWPVIQQQLTHLYKRCLENSFFPNCWKDAEVVVLLKSKDKDPYF